MQSVVTCPMVGESTTQSKQASNWLHCLWNSFYPICLIVVSARVIVCTYGILSIGKNQFLTRPTPPAPAVAHDQKQNTPVAILIYAPFHWLTASRSFSISNSEQTYSLSDNAFVVRIEFCCLNSFCICERLKTLKM